LVDAPRPKQTTAREHERQCAAGDMWSCTVIGILYQLGDETEQVPVNWRKALGYLEPACTAKVPEACASLIVMLESGGEGVPKDDARAAELVKQMCADGWDHYCTR
jgi:TPR repeat protein